LTAVKEKQKRNDAKPKEGEEKGTEGREEEGR